jgi:RNA polymerase sigma factor for flagellar operon FliA
MPLSDDQAHALWVQYRQSGDKRLRDRLFVSYSPLVKYVAGKVGSGLPAHIDNEELIGYGLEGLLDALESYRPELGVKFETYALPRIRGEILDGLRKLDWAPRSARARMRELARVMAELQGQFGRPATDAEVAGKMRITIAEHADLLAERSRLVHMSLDSPQGEDGEGSVVDSLVDPRPRDPIDEVVAIDLKEQVAAALAQLPERERIVVTLYYYEELTLREIGEVLDVTESRVSQLLTKASLRLKPLLRDLDWLPS